MKYGGKDISPKDDCRNKEIVNQMQYQQNDAVILLYLLWLIPRLFFYEIKIFFYKQMTTKMSIKTLQFIFSLRSYAIL